MIEFDIPPSPYRRFSGVTLAALAASALAGASLTNIDITSQAVGRVTPVANVRPVDSHISGKVVHVFAVEGQLLKAGDPILELDSVDAVSERNILQEKIDRLSSSARFYESLVSTLRMFDPADEKFLVGPQSFFFAAQEGESSDLLASRQAALTELSARILDLDRQGEAIKSTIRGLDAAIERERRTMAIEYDKIAITEKLFKSGNISRQEQLTRTRPYIESSSNLDISRQDRAAKEAELRSLQFRRKALIAESHQKWQQALQTAKGSLTEASARLAVVLRNLELSTVRAPSAGRLEELKVRSEGARVTESQTIAKLVPISGPMIVEARLPAHEAAFVFEGQDARIKFDAYPAERYGSLRAKVISVSADTVQDQINGNWSYVLRLKPESSTLNTSVGAVLLSPGMTAKVDIVTGSRLVISYFLEPINESLADGFRER